MGGGQHGTNFHPTGTFPKEGAPARALVAVLESMAAALQNTSVAAAALLGALAPLPVHAEGLPIIGTLLESEEAKQLGFPTAEAFENATPEQAKAGLRALADMIDKLDAPVDPAWRSR